MLRAFLFLLTAAIVTIVCVFIYQKQWVNYTNTEFKSENIRQGEKRNKARSSNSFRKSSLSKSQSNHLYDAQIKIQTSDMTANNSSASQLGVNPENRKNTQVNTGHHVKPFLLSMQSDKDVVGVDYSDQPLNSDDQGQADIESQPGNYWIKLKLPGTKMLLLIGSVAYYDDRPKVTDSPCLRLLVVCLFSKIKSVEEIIQNGTLFRVELESGNWYTIPPSNSSLDGTSKGKKHIALNPYKQHLLTLSLASVPLTARPRIVRLTSMQGIYPDVTVPVTYPREDNPQEFMICVKPLYGSLSETDVDLLIEWFQVHMHFGVREFVIYNTTLTTSPRLERVLNHFSSVLRVLRLVDLGDEWLRGQVRPDGQVRVRTGGVWRQGVELGDEQQYSDLFGRAAYADCLYTNYKRISYLMLLDIDEMIVPRIHSNYSALFSYLSNEHIVKRQTSSFCAEMIFFYRNGSAAGNSSRELKSEFQVSLFYPSGVVEGLQLSATGLASLYFQVLNIQHGARYLMDTVGPNLSAKAKSFIDTQSCILPYFHYCLQPPQKWQKFQLLSPSIIMTHHYRQTEKGVLVNQSKYFTDDQIMDNFTDILSNFKLKHSHLYVT